MTAPPPESRAGDAEALLAAAARLFQAAGPEASRAEAAALLAAAAAAPVAAVGRIRDGGAVDWAWHAADPALGERFADAFAEAARELPSPRATGVASATAQGDPCFACAVASGDTTVVAAAGWPGAESPPPGATEALARAAALAAARADLDEWGLRYEAQRVGYERWFRTLDQQLRTLDRERQKFSAVVRQPDIHVFVAGVDGAITWTNAAMTQLAPEGQPSGEWLGRRCADLCGALGGAAAAGACAVCPVALALDANDVAHHELPGARHGVTRTLYMTALPIRGADGLPHEVLVMLQDLTDLHVVRRSESRYRQLFERSANAIVMVDPHRQCLVVANAMTARMLGYAPRQLEGRPLRDLIEAAQWPEFERLCSSVAAAGRLEGFECRLRTRDGEERVAVVSPSRFDLDGEEVLLLEFLDVTGRKRAEEALREREHQLRQSQKMEAVGRLAGGIAHGFNNLLAVIMGRIGLIRERLPADHPVRRDAEQIHNACVQGSWLTRHLLTFSRKEMAAPRVVDLRAAVTEIDHMLRCVLGEKIELVTAVGAAPAPVLIDQTQMEQVLLNLVINARDAMPHGGIITIELDSVRLDEPAARERGAAAPGDYLRLSVRDDGMGMDEDTRARLFEPFFTTKERGKGSGLGMSIVYGSVTQAGGHLEVSSEVGLGTTVTIYLPRALEDAADLVEPQAVESVPGGETVLVVEDDAPVRSMACEALELEGYRVLSASGGQEALDLVERHRGRVDLMVTDVVMPGMSGGELARRLAALRPETRVIFISGYVDDQVVRDGVLSDGAPFLQKPFSLEALALKAREVLDTPRPESARSAR